MSKFVKEIFIILLLCMVVIFTIGLLFYDCIPQKNEKIETIEYVASKDVLETLEQINANVGVNDEGNDESSLLKSYSIGKDDLTEFASENSYETGKKDPFAEYATPVEDEVVKVVTTTPEVTNTQVNNQEKKADNSEIEKAVNNTTKEEVKESSTGKYIEKKNSK